MQIFFFVQRMKINPNENCLSVTIHWPSPINQEYQVHEQMMKREGMNDIERKGEREREGDSECGFVGIYFRFIAKKFNSIER